MPLRDYQENCLNLSLSHYQMGVNRQLAVLATGLGKCLGKGTPVLMYDGTIMPVESIRVGDRLMGPDSGPRRVVSLAHGREEMFRVIPVKGDPYTVNRSHILSLKMTPRGTQYPCYLGKRVDMSVDEYLKQSATFKHMAKGWRTGVEFHAHRDEPAYIPAYLLGVWLGDGNTNGTGITTGDKEIAAYIEAIASANGLRVRVNENSANSKVYSITAKRRNKDRNIFREGLQRYGILGSKSIPHRYMTGSRQERLDLLAGILDTDGHLVDGCFDLCLKSERLLDQTIFVARSLGFASYKSAQRKTCCNNGKVGTYYRCAISGPTDQIPTRIPHKQSKTRLQKKDHLVTGLRLESIGEGEYFGFEIEGPDRLFLLGDFTVTHNTAIAANLRAHHGFTKPIIFLVHYETLAVQAATAMQRWNPDLRVAVEMAGSYANMDGFYPPQFIVASVPTLGRKGSDRIKRFLPGDFAAVIQDEAHLGQADSFKRVYEHFGLMEPNPDGMLFLGITATPNRADGQGLRDLFDAIVFDMGIQKGIADGWLCDLVGYRVNGKAQLDKVHTRLGDFAQDELEKEVNTPARNAIIVKEWYKYAYDKRTLIFTVDIQHALDLAAAFSAHGEPAEAVWGDDPDRHSKIRRHKTGEYHVLCNCNVLGIGYDDPEIECIVSAAPTKSELRYVQQVGRGTRIATGKENCIVIDVVDNSSKHSLTTISTLLGLPKNLDLKGESYTKAKQQLDRIAAEFPTANVQDIKSLDQLKSLAENINLFQVSYPPEISRLSELAWRKSAEGYMLAVNRDLVTIAKDLREEWQIRGRIGDSVAELSAQNLSGAMNLADQFVLDHGGVKGYLKRDVRWRGDPPTEKQLGLCRILKITVPPGMTKGAVSQAIDAKRIQMAATKAAEEPEYQGEW